jgi:hypothetical protein
MHVAMGRQGAKALPGWEQKEFSLHLQQLAKEIMIMHLGACVGPETHGCLIQQVKRPTLFYFLKGLLHV